MSATPAVSILMPFYQAGVTLNACLHSIARQTRSDWECVLIDDGSTDNGVRVARVTAECDPRVRLFTRPHAGLVAALNFGLEQCRAPWVARMDADDLMHRRRLELQLAAVEREPGLAGVGAHVRFFPRRGMTDGLRDYERWLNAVDSPAAVRREAYIESPLAHPTLLLRRELFKQARYEDRGWPEDYDLVLRLLGAGHELGVVRKRLHAWRDAPTRLTRTHAAYRQESLTACRAHHLAQQFLRTHDRYLLWGHGETGSALRRALLRHGKRPSHVIELHPRRLGNSIDGAPVVHPEALRELPRLPLIASVAGAGPRAEIRAFLAARELVEGRDFVCAA